ncbi:MAG: class I SAM-dependent methyltransferase [Wenzhouxiangella sp.]|nr:MAG: class I SAM-dependent methyltransferase [Wenzhouxiangella sp.]
MSADHEFAADWLSLREPADHAARPQALLDPLLAALPDSSPLNVIDLGAGHGSNLRWLAPRLQRTQRWLLIDRDPRLLQAACEQARHDPPARAIEIETLQTDLARTDFSWLSGADLVTASAWFDLVSADWIEHLAKACANARIVALFALSVDGRWQFLDTAGDIDSDRDDEFVRNCFNAHQRRNKGLGDALGAQAAAALPRILAAHGFSVMTRASEWSLPAGESMTRALGRMLLEGWQQAAAEQAPDQAERIRRWRDRRRARLDLGRLGLVVGHVDVLALPAA